MRHWLTGMILLAVGTPAQAETSASEFLQLSAHRQAAYVAGIFQGMSYVMFNYDRAGIGPLPHRIPAWRQGC